MVKSSTPVWYDDVKAEFAGGDPDGDCYKDVVQFVLITFRLRGTAGEDALRHRSIDKGVDIGLIKRIDEVAKPVRTYRISSAHIQSLGRTVRNAVVNCSPRQGVMSGSVEGDRAVDRGDVGGIEILIHNLNGEMAETEAPVEKAVARAVLGLGKSRRQAE